MENCTDIPDRGETVQRIRISEIRYRRLFETAKDGILLLDPVSRQITEANPYMTTLLGYSREELLGQELWQIGLLRDEAASLAAFQQLKREGFIRYDDLPLQTKTGERRDVEFVSNLYDEDGNNVIQCNIRDITDRKRAEEALRASEERYRTLFNSMDEGYCVIEMIFDVEGRPIDYRFLEVNPAFEKQSGMSDVTGKRMLEFIAHIENHWLENYGRVALTGNAVRFANEYKALGRWFDVYAFRLGAPDSRKVAVIFNDITGARQITLELQNARDAAVAASRAKDDFLAALSHELRTPLNPALLIASDAATNLELAEDVRADFEMIRRNIILEARLIDDLLDLTRISRGKLNIDLQPCDVHVVMRDAVAVVQSDILRKRIRLVLDLTAERSNVMGDPVRLEQIFWNVLSNSAHFTPDEGEITVQTRVTPSGKSLLVTMADTGVGIAPKDLTRIFETFAQGETVSGKPRRSGGLGLGLAISRTLVELHGGTIAAASQGRGGGSTFTITLPLLAELPSGLGEVPQTEAIAATRSSPAAEKDVAAAGHESKPCVLVVEDHQTTRITLERLLERRNFKVLAAGSVAEALALASQHTITLVISDIGLPDADGYSLMRQLKFVHPDLHGIAMSGYGSEADLAKSREAGFSEHLTKPVGIEDLDRALWRLRESTPPTS